MAEGSEALLQIEDLRIYYLVPEGVIKAIDGVNLKIMEKEVTGIVGESGCGKSSLALSIVRMLPSPPAKIVAGKIKYNGRDLLQMPEGAMTRIRGKEIGVVFQDPMTYLNPTMKIVQQITEKIVLHDRLPKDEAKREAISLLEAVEMPAAKTVMNYYPFQLSGGMLQRVLLVIALACRPSLIIADEPTTALDVTVQAQILGVLRNLVDTFGMSVIVITHDMGIVAAICDRVYVMYAGRIAEESPVDSLFENPQHPYTSALLASVFSVGQYREDLVSIRGTIPNLADPPSGCRFHPRCPHAMNVCQEREPPRFQLSEAHASYCWLLDDEHAASSN
jgi:oligopeptide/dipeptide ABC transporter ATP-binding protein